MSYKKSGVIALPVNYLYRNRQWPVNMEGDSVFIHALIHDVMSPAVSWGISNRYHYAQAYYVATIIVL